jgi:hypothetical protein
VVYLVAFGDMSFFYIGMRLEVSMTIRITVVPTWHFAASKLQKCSKKLIVSAIKVEIT